MQARPTKQQHPEFNLEALLSLLGLLLGFLFIVVIYVLENPQEVFSAWGFPLIFYLLICYAIGLTNIALIISHEVNLYLLNRLATLDPEKIPAAKFTELSQNIQRTLRQSIKLFTFFIFGFGLFLINLAGFAAAKIFYSFFALLESLVFILWSPLAVLPVRFIVMFLVQFVLIIPFARYQGLIWDSYKAVEQIQLQSINSEQ
ncbi:MAG: hypothetical protein ACFE89_08680 [Candidatus Hodarchaeota archaeon]